MHQPPSEPAESRTAISVKDLHFSYGRTPAVVGFKWELPAGCVAALFGHSGAGKSTILALLAGALPRAQGTVEVHGTDPTRSAGRQYLGYMPQTGGLYGGHTVEENLRTFAVGAGPHGSLGASMGRMLEPFFIGGRRQAMIDAAVERTLNAIQLTARRHDPVGSLSAALQQRVSLGVALLWTPDVLLLDEPLSMADDAWARDAWKLFKDLAGRGHTIVMATGRARDAIGADRVALLRAGRLVQAGETKVLAPPGKATIGLKYVQKTGPVSEDVEVQDLATELPGLMDRKPGAKPIEVNIRQESQESRLEALLHVQ